jgi:predicted RNA-binding protein YlxR (DUF448 family)
LLRVVVAPDALVISSAAGSGSGQVTIVPDPRGRLPGRGAWVHPVVGCVELAERRRAFARALRVPGPGDPAAVRTFVEQVGVPTSGIPQE